MDTEPAASSSLSDDIEVLRAMVIALMTERDAVIVEARHTAGTERTVVASAAEARAHAVRHESERLPEEQLQLGLEAIEQAIAQNEAEAEKRDPKLRKDRIATRRSRNAALPADLPRSR